MFNFTQNSSLLAERTQMMLAAPMLMLLIPFYQVSDVDHPTKELHAGRVTQSFTIPIETNVVAAIEAGVIMKSNVKEGDRVSAGDQLAVLNSAVLIQTRRRAVALSQSTANRDAAKARMEMIRSQKENLESLISEGHVNQYEMSQKVAEYESAVAEFKTTDDELMMAEIEVDRIDAEISQRIIKSPINGFVTRIHKKLGEQVSNNEPDYATVVRINELKVKFYLDSSTLDSIKDGSTVTVLLGKKRKPIAARVIYVSPIIDPDSGTGRVEVAIDNRDYKIRSGTICFFDDSKNGGRFAGNNFDSGTRNK